MSCDKRTSFEATDHLLRTSRNADRLLKAIGDLEADVRITVTPWLTGLPRVDECQPQSVEVGDVAGRKRGPG